MNRKSFERLILSYSMRMVRYPKNVEDTRIHGTDTVNIHIVNSKFETLYEKPNVPVSVWTDTYNTLYETYKEKNDHYSRYIIVSDNNDNVYYCTKLINQTTCQ